MLNEKVMQVLSHFLFLILQFSIIMGLPGFDSVDLWKCKHAVRWVISTLI